jgi:hypothetical protein
MPWKQGQKIWFGVKRKRRRKDYAADKGLKTSPAAEAFMPLFYTTYGGAHDVYARFLS